MFDGFEMGLFPVISRPALAELFRSSGITDAKQVEALVGQWNGLTIAGFLIGAATGGVLFGWLGDRIGRVRAMSLSILTYALVSGVGAFATAPWHIVLVRFIAALGMGGEWSLGVALVMEVWQGRSRAMLAGLIGAAANAGYALVALLSLGLSSIRGTLTEWGFSSSWVEWRLLMMCGVLPALLTFFVRLYVPESHSWEKEKEKGATKGWATKDLLGVLLGAFACWGILILWSQPVSTWQRVAGTLLALSLVFLGYIYPVFRYLGRSSESEGSAKNILTRMLLGVMLSSIPLLATWGAVQWAPTWADQLANPPQAVETAGVSKNPQARAYTTLFSALGAIVGAFAGALIAGRVGRRWTYAGLCLASMGSVLLFYQTNTEFNSWFIITCTLMGGCSAAFYGWLPLYLPELFPTRVRATGQGFSFNFGRILAAIGALQTGAIMGAFQGGYPEACSLMGSIYLLGIALVWLAPETHGKEMPE
ncbi:MAG: MFS transporter [Gemmataceae bacterium]|nr:MFS transporter [Gemmataceae bacterium]